MPKPYRLRPMQRSKVSQPTAGFWPPVITEDAVYLPDCYHAVFRLAPDSLAVQWRVPCEWTMPAFVCGDTLVLAASEGSLAVACQDGRLIWGPVPTGGCHLWGDQILSARPLAILDPASGEQRTRLPLSDEIVGDTFVAGDFIVGTTLRGDPVTAFDLQGQRVVWQRSLIAEAEGSVGCKEPTRIVHAERDRFLVVRKDHIFGCSLIDGSILWDAAAEMTYSSPLIISGRLYYLANNLLRGKGPHLYCLDLNTGRQVYEVPQALLQFTDTPLPGVGDESQVVFHSRHGLVISCTPDNGLPIWYYKHSPGVGTLALLGTRVLAGTCDGFVLSFSALSQPTAPGEVGAA